MNSKPKVPRPSKPGVAGSSPAWRAEALPLLTLDEVAGRISCSLSHVKRLVAAKQLRTVRPGESMVRVRPEDLEEFIQGHAEGA